ncbi:MAG: C40 family peptidase [Peptostreptococcaceae bacterium]
MIISKGGDNIKKILKLGFILLIISVGFLFYNKNIENEYIQETRDISKEDLKTINEVIKLAKEKVGLEYVWGGKGEIMTDKRLDELIKQYGISHYPLDRNDYIGNQAFDCSGLTYWTYKEITKIEIGYSTFQQKEILKDFSVDKSEMNPGDLIYTPGHVVMYIGKGKVIESASHVAYPVGGVKISSLFRYRKGEIYRPIDYINHIKNL